MRSLSSQRILHNKLKHSTYCLSPFAVSSVSSLFLSMLVCHLHLAPYISSPSFSLKKPLCILAVLSPPCSISHIYYVLVRQQGCSQVVWEMLTRSAVSWQLQQDWKAKWWETGQRVKREQCWFREGTENLFWLFKPCWAEIINVVKVEKLQLCPGICNQITNLDFNSGPVSRRFAKGGPESGDSENLIWNSSAL